MEYLSGGDLGHLLLTQGRFSPGRARLYAAEIAVAVIFLHQRSILHRDLKLDNVLLDSEGHVKIADLGMCRDWLQRGERADTFCGTPHYMAPEVVAGRGYGAAADWWSYGVLLYEMISGYTPFGSAAEDDTDVFRDILHTKIRSGARQNLLNLIISSYH